jgi:hypothetical protein
MKLSLLILLAFAASTATAGEVDVIRVAAKKTAQNTYRFDVTLRHDDTGWDHYANKWEVAAPDGTVLATRVLAHPHVEEQPFTRSLTGIKIPGSTRQVIVRGGDSVHGLGGAEKVVSVD